MRHDDIVVRNRRVRRADSLRASISRAPDSLRRGRGARPGRGIAGSRADDGGLDARLVPGPRVCAASRGHLGHRARTASPWRSPRCGRTAGGCRTGGAGEVIVSYRVYARTMSVQGNWVDSSFALLNGAATFLTLAGSGLATARGHARAARRLEDQRHGASRRRGPSAAPLRRGRFRHAGRFADLRGQPGDLRVPGRWRAALPGQRGRRGPLGRPALGPRCRGDRPGPEGLLGLAPLREVRLLQPPDRERRRARAQELDGAHGQPLGDADPLELPVVAQPRQPRVLPHLERQAVAARRARPVRLRERGLHAQPLGRRGDHQLLRPAAGAPGRAVHRRGVPGRRPSLARLRHRQDDERHRAAPDHARPAGPAARGIVVRRLDQVLPPRREHPEHRHQLLRQGGRGRASCSTRRSARRPAGRRASTT